MTDPESAPAPDGSATRHERMVLVLTATAQFMVVLDVTVVNVALPSIGRALQYGPTTLQWVPNAYVLTFAGFLLLGGRIADFFGRRLAFVAGLALFVGASVLCATAQTGVWLITARAVQGVGSALLSPASLTIVVTTFSGRARSRAIAVWAAVASSGGTAGLFLGGVITTELGWRWNFFINIPVGLVVGLGALAFISEHRRTAGVRGLTVPGAVCVTAGLALLAYAVVDTNRYGWTSARTLGGLAVAAVLLGLFLVIQMRSKRPLMPLPLFRSRWMSGANTIVFLLGTWTFSGWYFLSLYLQDVEGYSPLRTGVALIPMTVMITLGSRISPRVVLHIGVRRTVQVALLMIIGGFVWLATLGASDGYWPVLFGGLMLTSAGQGLVFPPLAAAATGAVDGALAGLVSGLLNNARQIGGSIGLAALATIAAARTTVLDRTGSSRAVGLTGGYDRAFAIISGIGAVALGLTFVLPGRRDAIRLAEAAAEPAVGPEPARSAPEPAPVTSTQ